ncbi:hypothetical protein BKA66DRAFT_569151 [Pyrenochaeta sp. MPI-SDFR-AT-0127]|nr:hypothetical protein BKA66DRAFT_569151 [Pyrenochaeta sp. MPI-SDFR-AT-0127]
MEMISKIVDLNNTAGLMTQDRDLWITSRYERLHLINILAIQQRLSALESEIDGIVKYEKCFTDGEECGSPLPSERSEEILDEVQKTTKAYGDAIASLMMLKEIESPAPYVVKGLKDNRPSSTLVQKLCEPRIGNDVTPDLLSISTGHRTWFHKFVGRHGRLCRMFQTDEHDKMDHFVHYSEKRLRNAEFGIVAACLCLVQLLPVLALTLVSSKAARLSVIIVLIVVVSVLNAMFANTVRATNFGAIAAYSAIVVVFVSQKD